MPLTGVTILDLTRLLPGPYATRLLAELGAEVVKIEDPAGGDYARWYPPVEGDPPMSGIFRELNRGKKSVALDLRTETGREALRALVARADVLVDSFRPGVLARLGLDPRALMEAHPRLIYCALTGFGLTGPDAGRAGHDLGYIARAGILGLSGPAEAPFPPGAQLADIGGAHAAVSGILAALFARERTGRGQVVDVALNESALGFAAASFGLHHAGKVVQRGAEMLDGSRPAYAVYRTRDDRFLAVAALEPKFWQAFLGVVGLPELLGAALDGGAAGARAKAEIQAKLEAKSRDEWMALFREVEACVEPVLDLAEVEADPQLVARGMVDPAGMIRSPVRVGPWQGVGAPARTLSPAPGLGADTERVLEVAGVDVATRAAVQAKLGG